ncbi:hypothetical protein JL721_9560 [Aureococcus anophagefferens]|nr:hypothetical protein JL721_9560 [Aureococcus anophagefferens]
MVRGSHGLRKAIAKLAEDEEWYKEAYGVFNKKKFGSGEAPGEGDRVTKFFYDGEAYDGTVAKVTVEDVRRRPGEKARRMKLWDVAFDDGDRAGLSEIEAVAARRAFSRCRAPGTQGHSAESAPIKFFA